MVNFALIVILAGFMILLGVGIWTTQRRQLGIQPEMEEDFLEQMRQQSSPHAVFVAKEYGQVIFVNETVREWLGVRGGTPSLEYVARQTNPTENFKKLFLEEATTTFRVGNRWVEGKSHRIPLSDGIGLVITLQEVQQQTQSNGVDLSTSMRIINELSDTINASLGVEQVLQTILAIISKNIKISAGEICLWNEKEQALYQRGWSGSSQYVIQLSTMGGVYYMGEGITGWIAKHHRPLLIEDTTAHDVVSPKVTSNPYRSVVGVPLMVGEEFIGTMEILHEDPNQFSHAELALLEAISNTCSMAIRNAELYAVQIRRIDDIASLQQITQDQEINESNIQIVYQALNKRIAELIDTEVSGILLYDDRRKMVLGQPPFHGLPDQLASIMSIRVDENAAANRIWTMEEYWMSNDLTDEPLLEDMGLSPIVSASGLRNIVLQVMKIGRQRIGMMFLANRRSFGGFSAPDIQNLRILVAQAAIVVENVRLFEREQRQDTEIVGLQEITHAIGALSSEDEVYVYSDINRRIAGLMEIEMCGIMLYDETSNRLIAQPPFYGVDDEYILDYEIDLNSNDFVRDLWDESDFWYSNRAQVDSVVFSVRLDDLATRVGVEKTLFASLTASGQKVGVIQVSNKLSGEDFTDNDARLLLIFATQAAAIIENARLVREIQRRADEANRLRMIAERAGNVVTLDETLAPVLSEVGHLLDSELVFLSVLNEDGQLVTHPRTVWGREIDQTLVLQSDQDQFAQTVVQMNRPLVTNNTTTDLPNIPVYRAHVETLAMQRMAIVPLMLGDVRLGELGIANRASGLYVDDDISLLKTVAAQIASTLDRVRLFEASAIDLERRSRELDAISHVSFVLNETTDFNTIIEDIRTQSAIATNAQGSTVAVLLSPDQWTDDAEMDNPQLVYRVGESDEMLRLVDIELAVLKQDSGALVIENYADVEMKPMPSQAASAVAIVFVFNNDPVGIIHLFDNRPDRFNDRTVIFLKTMASKAALGYGNAVRYYDQMERSRTLRQRVDQLNQIFELGQMIQTNVDPTVMLEAISYSIVQSVGFDVVVIAMIDEKEGLLKRVTQAGLPVDAFERSKSDVLPIEELDKLLHPELRISESYFYPIDTIIEWEIAGLDAVSAAFIGNRTIHAQGKDAWNDGDMLLVPIAGANKLLGIMSLDRPQDNRRPNRAKIEILEIFAHQAASTIENHRLYLSSVRSAEMESRLNAMMENVASTLDIDTIIELIAQNALRLAPFNHMSTVLTSSEHDDLFDLTHVIVHPDDTLTLSKEANVSIAGTSFESSIQSRQDLLFTSVEHMAHHPDLARWIDDGEYMAFVVPLMSGGEVLGALQFGTKSNRDFDVDELRPVFNRLAQLVAVSIQNARLFNQAVNLQVFNESVVESIQQGIVVLDIEGRVLSANEYVKTAYDWNMHHQQGLFDYAPELKESLAGALQWVLETGKPDEVSHVRTEGKRDYTVRNFYIYPLISRDTVNGAVLMIEDITDRERLEANIEARANQLAALTRASGRITSTLRRSRVIEIALEVIEDIIEYDAVTIWRRDGVSYMQLVGVKGVDVSLDPPIRMYVEEGERFNHIIEMRSVLTIDDLPLFLRTYPQSLPGDVNAKSWLGVPLIYQDAVIGMIALAKNEKAFYTPQSEQALMAFANQMAVALTNAELFTETSARTERLSVLNRVSLALVQSMDSENIMEIALNEMAIAINAEQSRAILFDNDNALGRVIVDVPRGDSAPTQQIQIAESSVFKYITDQKHALVFSHNRANMPESLASNIVSEIEARGLKDYLLVPMVAPGIVIGAFEFETRNQALLINAETLEMSLIIANQTAIAIQNANQLEETTIRTRELSTLLEAAQTTSLVSDLQQVFHTVTDLFINALDMDDCAIMIWDDMDGVLEVEIDVNRHGDPDRISPKGTKLDLEEYPLREKALRNREVVVIYADDEDMDAAEVRDLNLQGDSLRMLVPLIVRDQSKGLIQVELADPTREITEQELGLARALGAQVAIAIENAMLSTESATQMEELFAINELSQAISSKLDLDSLLPIIRDQVPRVTAANQLYLALYDEETKTISFPLAVKDNQPYDIPSRSLGEDEVSFVIKQRRALLLGSDYYAADDVRRSLGIISAEENNQSYLGVPLVSGDAILGVLAVLDENKTRVFGMNDQRILMTIGAQIGAALQNARLFNRVQSFADELNAMVQDRTVELQEERDRLDMLYQITAELALTLDMDRVLNRALQMMASAVRAHDGVIMLIDPMNDQFYNRASLSHMASEEERLSHPAEAIASWLIHNEHELLVNDLHEEEFWDKNLPGAESWRSAMAVLLETNEDVQGVLVLLSRDVDAFSDPLLNLVIAAANQVASAINNADLYQLIRDQAERLGTLLRTEQEEAEKSNAILESIADGVMMIDAQSQISLLNNAAEEMLALPRDLILDRNLSELAEQYSTAKTWAEPIIQWAQKNVDSIDRTYFPPERIEVGDRVVSMNIAPVFVSGQYLGAVSVFRDVTRDVEVDNMKNQFILNVSHELRTPITPIKGFADMMLVTGSMSGMSSQQLENLAVIKSNADRLARLVEDLLTISKIDAGESPLNGEPVDLGEVINVQLTNARNRHYDKHHTLDVDIAEGLPPAILDRAKVMQIVSNIIDNAFNYTPANGKIQVSLQYDDQRENHLLFTVKDNGLGIPQNFKDKIWERFSRHDEHALETETAGTGLGLSIVRELVQMHSGEVWFNSSDGEGTTFFVTFPIDYRQMVRAENAVSSSENGADGSI